MSCVREVEDRDAVKPERTAMDRCVSADVDDYHARTKHPVRARQFAGRNRTVVDEVVIGSILLDRLPGESERSSRSEDHGFSLEAQPSGADHVIESSSLGRQVIGSVAGFYVVVVGAAIEREMAG